MSKNRSLSFKNIAVCLVLIKKPREGSSEQANKKNWKLKFEGEGNNNIFIVMNLQKHLVIEKIQV